MSNYFQVLKRIEKDRSDRPSTAPSDPPSAAATAAVSAAPPAPAVVPPPPAAVTPPAPAPKPLRSIAPPVVAIPPAAAAAASSARTAAPPALSASPRPASPPLSDEAKRGIATLFDNIRALASGHATRTLVFSGAAATDSVHAVVDGLAQHAQRHGMAVFVAQLVPTESGPTLVARSAEVPPLTVDLNGSAAPGELSAWLDGAAVDSDLVLLEAPPLADSIDAALLACACDGLVIVADAEVTPRSALQVAAERAQVAGCRTLGVVMNGAKERMPSWMRRLFGNQHGRRGDA